MSGDEDVEDLLLENTKLKQKLRLVEEQETVLTQDRHYHHEGSEMTHNPLLVHRQTRCKLQKELDCLRKQIEDGQMHREARRLKDLSKVVDLELASVKSEYRALVKVNQHLYAHSEVARNAEKADEELLKEQRDEDAVFQRQQMSLQVRQQKLTHSLLHCQERIFAIQQKLKLGITFAEYQQMQQNVEQQKGDIKTLEAALRSEEEVHRQQSAQLISKRYDRDPLIAERRKLHEQKEKLVAMVENLSQALVQKKIELRRSYTNIFSKLHPLKNGNRTVVNDNS